MFHINWHDFNSDKACWLIPWKIWMPASRTTESDATYRQLSLITTTWPLRFTTAPLQAPMANHATRTIPLLPSGASMWDTLTLTIGLSSVTTATWGSLLRMSTLVMFVSSTPKPNTSATTLAVLALMVSRGTATWWIICSGLISAEALRCLRSLLERFKRAGPQSRRPCRADSLTPRSKSCEWVLGHRLYWTSLDYSERILIQWSWSTQLDFPGERSPLPCLGIAEQKNNIFHFRYDLNDFMNSINIMITNYDFWRPLMMTMMMMMTL